MVSLLSHAARLSLTTSSTPSMYNICAYLGQILLITGHYVALTSTKIFSMEGLDSYPYQTAQLWEKKISYLCQATE